MHSIFKIVRSLQAQIILEIHVNIYGILSLSLSLSLSLFDVHFVSEKKSLFSVNYSNTLFSVKFTLFYYKILLSQMTLSVFKLVLTMCYHAFKEKSVQFTEKVCKLKKSNVYVAVIYAFNYCTGIHFFVNESN